MKNKGKKFSLNNIRFKLVFGVFAILVPLIVILFYINIYAIQVIHDQVSETDKKLLTMYTQQIDASLDAADNYLYQLLIQGYFFENFTNLANDDQYVLHSVELSKKLARDIAPMKNIDALFYYNSEYKNLNYSYSTGSEGDIFERLALIDYLNTFLETNPVILADNYKIWFPVYVGGQYYLLRLLRVDNDFIGSWVNAKRMLVNMTNINLGDNGASALVGRDGKIIASSSPITDRNVNLNHSYDSYYLSGTNDQFLVVGQKATKGDISLVALIPDKLVLENLLWLKQIILGLAFCTILLIPFSLYLLRKTILMPINRIVLAMTKIRSGDIEIRLISPKKTSDEFIVFDETFNNMLDQIHDLKINIYEEKIISQKEELERLKLQINPHFFLNSLNMIYRLAQTKSNKLLLELSLCLIEYFRYSFRNTQSLVPMQDEIHHVRNYLRIQEMRFPGALTFDVSVSEMLHSIPVPPLIVQNFIENSVKYAVTLDEPVHFLVTAEMIEQSIEPAVEIIIQDTGKGFSEDILAELKSSQPIHDNEGVRVGIWNVRRRLHLLYNDQASIEFANIEPHGAQVRIVLPLKPDNMKGKILS